MAAEDADREGIEFFEKKIRPVLVSHCYECHSSQAASLEGNLSLETRDGMLQGGDRGPAIVPGDPDESLLLRALKYDEEDFQMPPKEALSKEIVADFTSWIERGAPDPRTAAAAPAYAVEIAEAKKRWPFTPPVEPAVPAVNDKAWPRNPIDHFILARLEASGLAPAAEADRRTLIRRVTYDLIGLPPTPEEVAAFLADDSPSAFAAVVDRLLDSPHYGERWGRHWLDVVRYADTAGDNSDYPVPQHYKYRNWVIDAINADMPYDEFVRQQIAGDLLPASNDAEKYQQIIATGYLANARRFGSRVSDYPQHLTIEDTIDNLGKAFLGMSLNCARCHNHKFDPFTAEDYYALYGIFHSTRFPWPGIELDKKQRDFVPLAGEEAVAAAKAERKKAEEAVAAEVKAADEEKKQADKLAKEKSERLEELKKNDAPEDERQRVEKELKEAKEQVAELDKRLKAARKKKDELDKTPLPLEVAYAVSDAAKIENCKVQIKGDPTKLGNEVPRRFPLVLGGQAVPADEKGSGRKQLAEWIAANDNPLTARVMANRIWQWHFGRGIVPTPNDFGRQGQPPTHPELLDWLAIRFVESGWSLKSMHRLILMSATYRQGPAILDFGLPILDLENGPSDPANPKSKIQNPKSIDPQNDLLWHFPRRRLDAESIRDTLLVLGGNLDRSTGGEHPFPPQRDWDFTQHKPFKAVYETNRRSVYLMTQRIQRHPLMAVFDGPDTGASTGRRPTSTTPLQALYFLNDLFVHEQAALVAARLRAASSANAERIDRAYELLFSRQPTDEERSIAEQYLAKVCESAEGDKAEERAWESLVRALLRTNEFVYLD